MRVLITGAGGQVGRELVDAFDGHDVVAVDHDQLDVADRDAVLGTVTSVAPDVVVNTAAWTDVDANEADPDRAWAVNALAVRHLADGARRVGRVGLPPVDRLRVRRHQGRALRRVGPTQPDVDVRALEARR